MPKKLDSTLFNYILTQRSLNHEAPFDIIEAQIAKAISFVEKERINAHVSNIVLNINNQLVLAQMYVERKNGFSASKNDQFGTTPTAYNIQFRFVFDQPLYLGKEQVLLPSGNFAKTLQPYMNSRHTVADDVYYSTNPAEIICGPGVELEIAPQQNQVTLRCKLSEDYVSFPYLETRGSGYIPINVGIYGGQNTKDVDYEYCSIEDYQTHRKVMGLYPLFYSVQEPQKKQGVLRYHHEYLGYTKVQKTENGERIEAFEPSQNSLRLQTYQQQLNHMQQAISQTPAGQRWAGTTHNPDTAYCFDILRINGFNIYTESGLPVIRLRNYQLDLLHRCDIFLDAVSAQNAKQKARSAIAGTISMGVGAGKTFFTFTLLQHIRYLRTQKDNTYIAPAYCMAPDTSVAEVTQKSINRQGLTTGVTATVISHSEQFSNPALFLSTYAKLSQAAAADAQTVFDYLTTGLQKTLLALAKEQKLHPNRLLSALFEDYTGQELDSRVKCYKNSMDFKRLILMVEGQKTIMEKTGMRGIDALQNLLTQFTTLSESIDVEQKKYIYNLKHSKKLPEESLFIDSSAFIIDEGILKQPTRLDINLREVKIELRDRTALLNQTWENRTVIRLTDITEQQLLIILEDKLLVRSQEPGKKEIKLNYLDIRNRLVKLSCLHDSEAAILLANSGGLGNTHTEAELKKQINRLLPVAYRALKELIDQYQMHYDGQQPFDLEQGISLSFALKEIYLNLPTNPDLATKLDKGLIKAESIRPHLYRKGLQRNIDLIHQIQKHIQEKINTLQKMQTLKLDQKEQQLLEQYGIKPTDSVIDAADQLAGIAGLMITGKAQGEDAHLLSSHIPVFTPEGFAAYLESLDQLAHQKQIQFHRRAGIYCLSDTHQIIAQDDIQARIEQILQAVMIADEAHKDTYSFLYDSHHPIHQRIDKITQKYCKKHFLDILPHRIGMSGTINAVAEKAFSEQIIYTLSTQQMIQQDILKKVTVNRPFNTPFFDTVPLDDKNEQLRFYAEQMVIQYFLPNSNLCIENLQSVKFSPAVDLFKVSKGIIFSKEANALLNQYIQRTFNLLCESPENLEGEARQQQERLFRMINTQRQAAFDELNTKLQNRIDLSSQEIEQIQQYNHENPDQAIPLIDGKRILIMRKLIDDSPLSTEVLRKIQRQMFENNAFVLYLEYVLSKSYAPREFSDLVGLQNKLFTQGQPITALTALTTHKEVASLIDAIQKIDPKSINPKDATNFYASRVRDPALLQQLISFTITYTNKIDAFSQALQAWARTHQFNTLAANAAQRDDFEAGYAMVMIGSDAERTGYSHEPIGIVVDVPPEIGQLQQINQKLAKLGKDNISGQDVAMLLEAMQTLMSQTFSYDEKNQAGGRALRTPHGQVRYLEYQTHTLDFLQNIPAQAMQAGSLHFLQLETSFADIFTSNQKHAQQQRISINFNRAILTIDSSGTLESFYHRIYEHFATQLAHSELSLQYLPLIHERVPLLWLMRTKPDSAAEYINTLNPEILAPIQKQAHQIHAQWLDSRTQKLKISPIQRPAITNTPSAEEDPSQPNINASVHPKQERRRTWDPLVSIAISTLLMAGVGIGVGALLSFLFPPLGSLVLLAGIAGAIGATIGLGLGIWYTRHRAKQHKPTPAITLEPGQEEDALSMYAQTSMRLGAANQAHYTNGQETPLQQNQQRHFQWSKGAAYPAQADQNQNKFDRDSQDLVF